MWNKSYVEEWSAKWDAAMSHTENFSAEIRGKQSAPGMFDRSSKSYDQRLGHDQERVHRAIALIRARGYAQPSQTALDIGSGTGIFTIPFARLYREVTSLDVSMGMQDVIRGKAADEALHNIVYQTADWHSLDLDRQGMRGAYDLVLSSINCRGVCDFESLNKMNQASRGGCCLLTWAGPGGNNHSRALNELLLGRQLRSAGGSDIIIPFNIIYALGGIPELTYAETCWEIRSKAADAEEEIAQNYWRFLDITPAVREKIHAYVAQHLEDGFYAERSRHRVGIMVWDAWRCAADQSNI